MVYESVSSDQDLGPLEIRLVDEVHAGAELGVNVERCFFEGEGNADGHADTEPVTVFGGRLTCAPTGVIAATPVVAANTHAVNAFTVIDDHVRWGRHMIVNAFTVIDDHVASPAIVAVFDTTADMEGKAANVPVAEGEFVDVLRVEVEVTSTVPATTGDEVDGAGFAQADLEGRCDDSSDGESDTEFTVKRAVGAARYRSFGVVCVALRARTLCGDELCAQTKRYGSDQYDQTLRERRL